MNGSNEPKLDRNFSTLFVIFVSVAFSSGGLIEKKTPKKPTWVMDLKSKMTNIA